MTLRAIFASLAAVAAVALSAPACASYVLSVSATPPLGTVGGQVVVDVNLSLDGGDTLLGVDFLLNFDPVVLTYAAGTEGSLTPGWAPVGFFDNGLGQISATMLDPDFLGLDSASGDITGSIAQLTFNLSAAGTSALQLSGVVLADIFGDPRQPSGMSGANIEVRGVPEPVTLLLVGLGLATLGWTRRRQVARTSTSI